MSQTVAVLDHYYLPDVHRAGQLVTLNGQLVRLTEVEERPYGVVLTYRHLRWYEELWEAFKELMEMP